MGAKSNAPNPIETQPRRINYRILFDKLGAEEVAALHTSIENAAKQDPLLDFAHKALGDYGPEGGIDFSHPAARAAIGSLFERKILTAGQARAVLDVAKSPA